MTAAAGLVEEVWERDVLPALHDYIAIPNVSPAYDAGWADHGHMERAVRLVHDWCAARAVPGLRIERHDLPGRTPLLLVEVPPAGGASAERTALLYGHLDKQPEMTGWRAGLGPWTPVREGNKLYGRGGADDGYSAFAALTALEVVHATGGAHTRCLVLIEASEESGSVDLPAHLDALGDRLGRVDLVVALDSGCLDYRHLWVTTSLRGLVGGRLEVGVLAHGVHSGQASGVVPSSFRLLRRLLDRLDDGETGTVRLPELFVDVPPDRLAQARDTVASLQPAASGLPLLPGVRPTTEDPLEQYLNQTWRPALSVTGADGLPPTAQAGNVLRPSTAVQLSMRIPPTCDVDTARAAVSRALTEDPPSGAHVRWDADHCGPGWHAPPLAPWLADSLDRASTAAFGAPARFVGEGGSIPFMGMLGDRFPDAQFVITGVLGLGSNAHGPDEYLHVPTAKRVTAAIADILTDHAAS